MTNLNKQLVRGEGMRRAALHFAEDFVIGLEQVGPEIYTSNSRKLQSYAKKNLGHEFNPSQIAGMMVFFRAGYIHKDNKYIFQLASFVCDLLDDRLDIRR